MIVICPVSLDCGFSRAHECPRDLYHEETPECKSDSPRRSYACPPCVEADPAAVARHVMNTRPTRDLWRPAPCMICGDVATWHAGSRELVCDACKPILQACYERDGKEWSALGSPFGFVLGPNGGDIQARGMDRDL